MALTDENNGGGIPATMLVGPATLGNMAQAMPYYPMPMMMGGGNNGGMGNGWGDGAWIILLIIVLLAAGGGWGNNNGGNGGGFGGGQPIIINDGNGGSNGYNFAVQRGFDQAAVMSGVNAIQNGIYNLSTQLCNCCGEMQNTVNQGFSAVQQSLCSGFAGVNATVNGAQNALAQQMYTNQIADLERSYAAQTANTQGMTALQSQLAQCCCDNRLATNDLRYTIATENCADRAAISDGIRDILAAQVAGFQSIKDELFRDRLDEKDDTIAQLRQEILFARGQASQIAQNQQVIDGIYNRLDQCPVGTTPVYGRTPIFSCNNNGCGCGNNVGGFNGTF